MAKQDVGRRGRVLLNDVYVGLVQQSEGLYSFQYDEKYLSSAGAQPVSLTLPLRTEAYVQKTMIPFFDGLIPEGWLLEIVTRNWKINKNDRMNLLLLACKDCIGNVSIVADEAKPIGQTPASRMKRR